MKAIQVKQVGGPEAMGLAELPVPQPKANEALVKLAASGVNFIDVYFREGDIRRRCRLCWGRKARAL
jgi:NADPH2:quinone reductase